MSNRARTGMAGSRFGSNQVPSLTSGTSQWSHRRDKAAAGEPARKRRGKERTIESLEGAWVWNSLSTQLRSCNTMHTRRNFHRILAGAGGGWLTHIGAAPASGQQSGTVQLQPLAVQVRRLMTALDSIGDPLNPADTAALNLAFAQTDETAAVERIQEILDRHVLLNVDINPESRVTPTRAAACAELLDQSWPTFLVKVTYQPRPTS